MERRDAPGDGTVVVGEQWLGNSPSIAGLHAGVADQRSGYAERPDRVAPLAHDALHGDRS